MSDQEEREAPQGVEPSQEPPVVDSGANLNDDAGSTGNNHNDLDTTVRSDNGS